MRNLDSYIREKFGDLPKKNIETIKKTMQKYEDNHWWESTDSVEIAMYQIFEPILLVPFGTFHEGFEKLVDRPVYTHEFGLNYEGLQKEAMLGIVRLKANIQGLTDEEKAKKINQSIEMLENYCKKTGKKFIKIDSIESDDNLN